MIEIAALVVGISVALSLRMTGVRRPEELDCWKLADEVRVCARRLCARPGFKQYRRLQGQLLEAAESGCPNVSEGFARFLPRDNARFLRYAKGSMSEVLAHLDRVDARSLAPLAETNKMRSFALRAIGAMNKFIQYLEQASPRGPRDTSDPNENSND